MKVESTNIGIDPNKTSMNVDKEVLERMMKDVDTEDVYIRSRKDGKIFRAKSQYAKRLIRMDRARFIMTVEEAKAQGITTDHIKELEVFADKNNKVIIK